MSVTEISLPNELRPTGYGRFGIGRRFVDIVISGLALAILAPLMLCIVFLIYLESGSPVLFSQIRLGQHGQPFRLYKFRKFRGGEASGGPAVTVKNDTRMSRAGWFLAQTKLDELPQLWNIFRGDMTIVGPRPEAEAFVDCFTGSYRDVLSFKPGLFGPNQVFFRSEAALYPVNEDPEVFYRDVLFPLKAQVDLVYFPHRDIGQDVEWIVRGVLAVLGLPTLRGRKADLIAEVEAWIRQGRQANGVRTSTRLRLGDG
jgi:lipopolysaccharide/colanic/teichoic acid biosynthesis glycosyltransferase